MTISIVAWLTLLCHLPVLTLWTVTFVSSPPVERRRVTISVQRGNEVMLPSSSACESLGGRVVILADLSPTAP